MTFLSDLLEAIYGTVADPALWPNVLERIGKAVTGTQTLLFMSQPDGSGFTFRCGETPDEVLYPFLEHYASVNVLSAPCDLMFKEGTARFSHMAMPDASFERSEFYQDFFRKNDLYYSMGVKNHSHEGALTYLSVQRAWRLGPFSHADGQVAALIMPHIRQALSLQNKMRLQEMQRHTTEHALAAFGRTVIGIDEKGRVHYANAAAERLLRDGSVLYQVGQRIYARDAAANQNLQMKLRTVLDFGAAFARSQYEALLLHDLQGSQAMQIVITPQRGGLHAFDSTIRAVVSISLPAEQSMPRGALLGSLYQLNATECRVADLLLAGKDPREVAEILNLTLATARFYVKRILVKTGTHKQSELIRLMLDLPAIGSDTLSL